MRDEIPNARFWIYWNGWVKITLRPGERIVLHHGGPTDEGFIYHEEAYLYGDGRVICDAETHSRDCDGPLSTYRSDICQVAELNDREWDADDLEWRSERGRFTPPSRPLWRKESASQRDHYAEAMGY